MGILHPMSQAIEPVPFSRYRNIVDDWNAFQDSIKRPLPVTLWTNSLKITPEQLQHSLQQANLTPAPISWYPGAFRLPPNVKPGHQWQFMAGLYQVQEEVAMLPVCLLDPQPGERVLDLCAAPGNKTAQIAVAMRNTGTVVANDRNPGRMQATRQTLNRLGLVNVTTTTYDAANFPREAGQFDRVLADVPCSCEGTCRKGSGPITSATEAEIRTLTGTQLAILRKAVQLCRPGGRIVYATCTFAPEENELVVDTVLAEFGEAIQVVPVADVGLRMAAGVTEWNGRSLHPSLAHTRRIWPHQNDTGGFYVAVLAKTKETHQTVPPTYTPLPPHTTEEPTPWLNIVCARFGIPPQKFAPFRIIRRSRRGVYLLNRDHLPPARPNPDACGMFFMRTDGRFPKLTTAAALFCGHWATQNFIPLTPEQIYPFLTRQDIRLTPAQTTHCTGQGYVIARFANHPLGIGIYLPPANGQPALLRSLFPKAWANMITKQG